MPQRSTIPLSISHPELSTEWDSSKNGNVTPEDVVAGSGKKYWWKCPKGPDHEWINSPNGRTGMGVRRCPFCTGKKVSTTNSLNSRFPEIAKQWHPDRNGNITPEQVVAGSSKNIGGFVFKALSTNG